MLHSAHKQLLLTLAADHATQVRQSLRLARSQLGEHHANVGQLIEQVELAEDCVHRLQREPVQVAA